ncbi:cobalamin biosynthesis protein [Ectothiorhodospiraceae bacterium WFHF3C12]|nr:cobalamin biosynthesis protein [Ectothiorhodospiraceae bacterium WFHF3C12]
MLTFWLAVPIALALDALLGEPRGWHPLAAFGRLAGRLERRLNDRRRSSGVLALAVLVVPVTLVATLAWWLPSAAHVVLSAAVLYLLIGGRSLAAHARAVADPLKGEDLIGARAAVGNLVSRDTGVMDHRAVAGATVESILENGSDAVFASLFWFMVAGLPGALLHRLVNTLDAMWGYRTERYEHFGWAAARLDDALNYVPARLTAATYAMTGRWQPAVRCWRDQGAQWDSPNAGPVMAAGAGALGVCVGGDAVYHGTVRRRPVLGEGPSAGADSIHAAIALLHRGLWLWAGLAALGAGLA